MAAPEGHVEVCIWILNRIHEIDFYGYLDDDDYDGPTPDVGDENRVAEGVSLGLRTEANDSLLCELGYKCADEPKCPGFWICWAASGYGTAVSRWEIEKARANLARSFRYHAAKTSQVNISRGVTP